MSQSNNNNNLNTNDAGMGYNKAVGKSVSWEANANGGIDYTYNDEHGKTTYSTNDTTPGESIKPNQYISHGSNGQQHTK